MRKTFNVQIKYSVGFPYLYFGKDGDEVTRTKKGLMAMWAKENDNKRAKLAIDDDISYSTRKFFEGAVAPYFFFQSEVAFSSVKEAREALKLEFGRKKYQRTVKGALQILPVSTTEYNKNEFNLFLKKIERDFEINQYEYPDSQIFKSWVDSAPPIGEIFPELKRLIEIWKKKTNRL